MHTLLRVAILLCLAVAVVALVALSDEYPGNTSAGRRAALDAVLPLALLAWAHLAALELPPPSRAAGGATAVAALGDGALLLYAVGRARPGAPPVALALPVVAALLLAGTAALAWHRRAPARRERTNR